MKIYRQLNNKFIVTKLKSIKFFVTFSEIDMQKLICILFIFSYIFTLISFEKQKKSCLLII